MKETMTFKNLKMINEECESDIVYGRKGWTKAKCLDDKCNTITLWNSKHNGLKCADGVCGKCGGKVKRTVWSLTTEYVVIK
jgi:hypothetical protein